MVGSCNCNKWEGGECLLWLFQPGDCKECLGVRVWWEDTTVGRGRTSSFFSVCPTAAPIIRWLEKCLNNGEMRWKNLVLFCFLNRNRPCIPYGKGERHNKLSVLAQMCKWEDTIDYSTELVCWTKILFLLSKWVHFGWSSQLYDTGVVGPTRNTAVPGQF